VALFEERDLARWAREARAWLALEDRRRTIGLVVLSVAISVVMSLIATVVVGLVSRRRATPGDVAPVDVGEPLAEVVPASEEAVGVPVMAAEGALAEVEPAQGFRA
jgi:hypothetical protein